MKCPCCSNKDYTDCCEPFITGEKQPATPETIMRSRYTAYTQGKIDYIERTMMGIALQTFNKEASQRWAEQLKWLGLEVIQSFINPENHNNGFVEFRAFFEENGERRTLHERSEFNKINGQWFYTQGKTPKIGRNDPCPCGCGKKYKKCCGKE